MKRRHLVLAALAVLLTLGAYLGAASAYFTTYADARGGYPIELGSHTDMYERLSQWTKHVTVTSDEGGEPVYVRVRAFWGMTYHVSYDGENGWRDGGDGYWYYDGILYGGEETAELAIHINDVPDNVEEGDSFNIVVIYESTPVQYDETGAPYADWSITLDTGYTGEVS